mmetsp:Transcript_1093/g.3439  ORF Transcript_1093/g.3439 Transcript_1093/m.3439 type:complete len:230 (+) Transcript_1093:653-1342(+)
MEKSGTLLVPRCTAASGSFASVAIESVSSTFRAHSSEVQSVSDGTSAASFTSPSFLTTRRVMVSSARPRTLSSAALFVPSNSSTSPREVDRSGRTRASVRASASSSTVRPSLPAAAPFGPMSAAISATTIVTCFFTRTSATTWSPRCTCESCESPSVASPCVAPPGGSPRCTIESSSVAPPNVAPPSAVLLGTTPCRVAPATRPPPAPTRSVDFRCTFPAPNSLTSLAM